MISPRKDNTLAARCVIGLLQGLYVYLLIKYIQLHVFTGAPEAYFFVPQILVAVFIPLLLMQGLRNMRTATLVKWGLTATTILLGVGYYSVYRQLYPGQTQVPYSLSTPDGSLFITLIITLFIAQSLILSSEADHKFRANYPTYFDLSWKLGLQALCSWFFIGVFWALLFLGAGLFKIIHLSFFYDLITSNWFACPATSLAVAVSIHSTDVNVRIIQGIRSMLLVLLSWLLPMMTAIVSLFLACLVFTGLAPLWKTRFAAGLIMGTTMIFILLINATFQDGSKIATHGRLHQLATRVACCLLLPLILIAAYALYLRVAQYGWSVSRLQAAFIMLILFSYSVGYLVAACITQRDLAFIEFCNFATSLLILAIAFAAFTPLADPARLMVNNQLARLQSGVVTPEKFDYVAMKYQGLRYGHAALIALQNSWQGASADFVKKTAEATLANNRSPENSATPRTSADLKSDIVLHTAGENIPDSFLQQSWNAYTDPNLPSCLASYRPTKCDAWMSKDQQNQVIIIIGDWNRFIAFQQNQQGKWEMRGTWNIPDRCYGEINQAMQRNDVKFAAPVPQGQDMIVGGRRLPFISSAGCRQ